MNRYDSVTGTTTAGVDLMSAFRTQSGVGNETTDSFRIDKFTFIADSAVSVKINGATNYSPLYLDPTDNKYKLSFDKGDIYIKSFVVQQDAVDYWAGWLY